MSNCKAMGFLGECREEATVKVRGGCQHEHVKERVLCPWHAEDLLRSDTRARCGECDELGHDCKVIAEVIEYGEKVS